MSGSKRESSIKENPELANSKTIAKIRLNFVIEILLLSRFVGYNDKAVIL
jgi:hypothetical protein